MTPAVGAALLGGRALARTSPVAGSALVHAAQNAFFHGFKVGVGVAAVTAVVGAALVTRVLPPRPTLTLEDELAELHSDKPS